MMGVVTVFAWLTDRKNGMISLDLQKITAIIAEVAATEIMPRFRQLAEGDIEMKGVNDPVTVADKAAEDALIVRLTQASPCSVVVGEESFAKDASIQSRFGGDDYVWVIDPIDGTRNFIEGTPEFGVMVALVHRKQTLAAWIHDPSTGDTLTAERGGGVWLGANKMRLAGHDASLPRIGLVGSRLAKLLTSSNIPPLPETLPKLVTGSAAAFDYGRLFTGDASFARSAAKRASFLIYRMSKPWDHVAGLLMLAETGGYAADLLGNPYDMERCETGLLIAPNQEAWDTLHRDARPAIEVLLRM